MIEPIDPNDGGLVEVPSTAVTAPRKKSAYKLLSITELMNQKPAQWLVKRVLRQGEQAVLFGDPSVGKTFIGLDLSLKLASGMDWWGYGVNSGPVVYLAAEGVGGMRQRAKAWALENYIELEDIPFFALPHAVIFGEDEQFAKFIAAIDELAEKPVLVVIDTLARCMAGCDENSAEEMGTFVDRCSQLQAFGAAALVIHHKNKNGSAERGSTALRGAADVMWDAVRTDDGTIKLFGSKAKDTELLPAIYLRTRPYTLGVDEDGEPETSLALQMGERPSEVSTHAPARGRSSAGKESFGEEVDLEEQGALIRETMVSLYNGGPVAGPTLQAASGIRRTAFYEVLRAEIAACRIGKDSEKRNPKYLLTELAPESKKQDPTSPSVPVPPAESSPSPSPAPDLKNLADSDSDSTPEASSALGGAGSGSVHHSPPDPLTRSESESESTGIPKGLAADSDSVGGAVARDPACESESESGAPPRGLVADSDSRSTSQPDPARKARRARAKQSPASGPGVADRATPASTFATDPPRGALTPADPGTPDGEAHDA